MFYLFWILAIAFAVSFSAIMVISLDNNGSFD